MKGGAIGAVWSTLLFYPADVAKIRLQAEADAHEEEEAQEASSPPLPAAAREPPTTTTTTASGGHGGHKGGGPKSFLGEVLVVLKRPDLWYAGLGTYVHSCIRLGLAHAFVCAPPDHESFIHSFVFDRPTPSSRTQA